MKGLLRRMIHSIPKLIMTYDIFNLTLFTTQTIATTDYQRKFARAIFYFSFKLENEVLCAIIVDVFLSIINHKSYYVLDVITNKIQQC